MVNVDPFDTSFLPCESAALFHMMEKVIQYQLQHRHLEARGIERAIGILHACLKNDFGNSVTKQGDL